MKDYWPSNFLQTWPILTPHTKEDSECPRQNWGKKSQQEHYQLRSFRKLGKAADFQVHVILAVLPSGQTVLTSFQTRYLERPFRCFDLDFKDYV